MNVGDYALEATVTIPFTTRAFATGIPTALASGEVQIYEDTSVTQITGAETLTVSLDSVAALNIVSIAATAANGFEAGKSSTAITRPHKWTCWARPQRLRTIRARPKARAPAIIRHFQSQSRLTTWAGPTAGWCLRRTSRAVLRRFMSIPCRSCRNDRDGSKLPVRRGSPPRPNPRANRSQSTRFPNTPTPMSGDGCIPVVPRTAPGR